MSISSNLYRLQQIDSKLDQAHTRDEEIEKILRQDSELLQAEHELDEVTRILDEEQKRYTKAETAVKDQRIKIEQTNAKLYGGKIHNPKELQDLQNESLALKRHLSVLEDRELEVMLSLEEIEQKHGNAQQNLNSTQGKVASQRAMLNGEKHTLLETINRLENDRNIVVSMISPDDLALYEQLRKQRRGVAVAMAVDKSCSACGSALSPALLQSAVTSSILVRCPACSRIIYPG